MNCLLNSCAFCLFVMAVLLSKVIVMLVACLGFLFESAVTVFQSLCVSFLWLQSSVMCCFHMFCLCCCICVSICVFSSVMSGCLWSCCLMVLRCLMSERMFSGRSFWLLRIFPWGMLCLSAVRMMVVRMLLAVWMLSGVCML